MNAALISIYLWKPSSEKPVAKKLSHATSVGYNLDGLPESGTESSAQPTQSPEDKGDSSFKTGKSMTASSDANRVNS
jgi:hypothetical protein